jgi:hypothetical protein
MLKCHFDAKYIQPMRTTLALDDDVLNIAKQKAQRENLSIGQAVSELMRAGIRAKHNQVTPRNSTTSKYAVLPRRDETITSEHVYKLQEQEGI